MCVCVFVYIGYLYIYNFVYKGVEEDKQRHGRTMWDKTLQKKTWTWERPWILAETEGGGDIL